MQVTTGQAVVMPVNSKLAEMSHLTQLCKFRITIICMELTDKIINNELFLVGLLTIFTQMTGAQSVKQMKSLQLL